MTHLIFVIFLLACGPVQAASLLFDDFNGTALDQSVWRLPAGPGTFFGRTQIKPANYNGDDLRPVVAGGTVTLQLDTHNASDPENSTFWGHEIQTFERFSVGTSGLSIKSRMRFLGSPPGGLVGGFFTWGLDNGIRDEIDYELLTNQINNESVTTNVFNNASFSDPGIFQIHTVPGYDMTQWNDYEIRWLPDRVQWFVNGAQTREQIIAVSGNPSEIRFNIWVPDEGFSAAFNPALQPTDLAGNQQYELQIDFVDISTVPLPPGILLFSSALGLLGWLRRRWIA
jgi:beta-glucanase (GH16 family)